MYEREEKMSKRVYIEYPPDGGYQEVIDVLHTCGIDNKHETALIDTAWVVSGAVLEDEDCWICNLKEELNRQINIFL